MPEWFVWTLIGAGVLVLLFLYFKLGGSGSHASGSPMARDRRTNESVIQQQSSSIRNQSSGGFGI